MDIFEILVVYVCCVDLNAALIPLAEFSDPVLMKRYELKPAPEVIDIVSTAATQKKIKMYDLSKRK